MSGTNDSTALVVKGTKGSARRWGLRTAVMISEDVLEDLRDAFESPAGGLMHTIQSANVNVNSFKRWTKVGEKILEEIDAAASNVEQAVKDGCDAEEIGKRQVELEKIVNGLSTYERLCVRLVEMLGVTEGMTARTIFRMINVHAFKDWRAGAWVAERMWPQLYGKTITEIQVGRTSSVDGLQAMNATLAVEAVRLLAQRGSVDFAKLSVTQFNNALLEVSVDDESRLGDARSQEEIEKVEAVDVEWDEKRDGDGNSNGNGNSVSGSGAEELGGGNGHAEQK